MPVNFYLILLTQSLTSPLLLQSLSALHASLCQSRTLKQGWFFSQLNLAISATVDQRDGLGSKQSFPFRAISPLIKFYLLEPVKLVIYVLLDQKIPFPMKSLLLIEHRLFGSHSSQVFIIDTWEGNSLTSDSRIF